MCSLTHSLSQVLFLGQKETVLSERLNEKIETTFRPVYVFSSCVETDLTAPSIMQTRRRPPPLSLLSTTRSAVVRIPQLTQPRDGVLIVL